MSIRFTMRGLIQATSFHMPLADNSVSMVATSPPYYNLRDYKAMGQIGNERKLDCKGWATDQNCFRCYVCHIREVAAEVWRVLHPSGTFWLNLGDSYHDKHLLGTPWLVALALKTDGWVLRNDIVWNKSNGMPEPVNDRLTKTHEYVFLLVKREDYFFDNHAIREPYTEPMDRWGGEKLVANGRGNWDEGVGQETYRDRNFRPDPAGRNKRTVWTLPTDPYAGAHYACWPPALVETMIKAGSSEKGICPTCRLPWTRIVEKGEPEPRHDNPNPVLPYTAESGHTQGMGASTLHMVRKVDTVGWRPGCTCPLHDPIPAVVLDPFVGSGTTVIEAKKLGRVGIGLDINHSYLVNQALDRTGLKAEREFVNGKVDKNDYSGLFVTPVQGKLL